ncbi:AAWKG family protein [Streptomyces sp. TS71-3]|uniref:AAWKG family protein n=1 Tax=Streptomyces sp. TS71-3 TaxID=2733862 RepID=UPI001B01014E|nr:AAWKG family protein [Streptomyces sp. TS71-3]GHJ36958.1 hypothetical protein Sm713_25670 [Streptomyces sp. TS71-3]
MAASFGQNDVWGQAINLLTGYPMPDRATLFDKISSVPDKIPLFRGDIQGPDPVAGLTTDDFTGLAQGVWLPKGETYDLPFYARFGAGAAGLYKARLVFIGVPEVNGVVDLPDDGQMSEGGPFQGSYTHTDWDTGPMSQYISGSRAALDKLVNDHTTYNFAYSGATVPHEDSVDLNTFEDIAKSFDRTTKFFSEHGKTLAAWEKSLGSEQASWKGQAAGVFWNLLHMLNKNYESYVEQLGGENYAASNTTVGGYTPTSKYADSMAKAQRNLYDQATALQTAWGNWATGYGAHWPHRWLLNVLADLTTWVIQNNATQVMKDGSVTGQFTSTHPVYGDLTNFANWKKVGEDAVQRWNKHVDDVLTPAAGNALVALKTAWADASENFGDPLETKNTKSLSDINTKEQADKEKAEADKEKDDANDKLNDALNQNNQNLNDINKGLNDGLKNVGDGLNNGLGGLNNNLSNLGGGLNDGLKNVGDGLNNSLNGLGGGLNDGLKGIGDGLNGGLGGLNNNLAGLGGGPGGLGALGGGPGGLAGLAGGPGGPNALFSNGPLNNGLNGANNNPLTGGDKEGLNSLTNPDGSTTQLNSDGSLTTTNPDGSTSTFNPSTGKMTTTSPDGKTSVNTLSPNKTVTNPDGSTTKLNPDGSLTTKFPDGTSSTVDPSTGAVTTTNADGSTSHSALNPQLGSFSTPDGGSAHLNSDGSLSTKFPDGSTETINPHDHTVTTTSPDGTQHTSHLDTGQSVHNPDGSTTKLNPDGSLSTKFPDGTTQVVKPDGTLQTTNPDGTTSTSHLNGGDNGQGNLDTSGLNDTLDKLNHLGSGHDLNVPNLDTGGGHHGGLPDTSGPLNSGLSSGGGHDAASSFEDLQDPSFNGGALGAPAGGAANAAAASGFPPGGTPLNPGLGGMGGMGGGMGGGGAGGSSNNGERVRTVHGESDGAFRRPSRRGEAVDEGEDLVPPRRSITSSGAPGSTTPGAKQGGRSTESGERPSYVVDEEEDVWGTEDGGAPAVIG